MARAVAAGNWRTDPPPTEQWMEGVRVLRFHPPGIVRGTVLHFHGGGYRMGCPEIVGPYAAALARRCGVEVVCPAYRLAPEYPFPAGVKDGLAVLCELAGERRGPLILSGDSAGGGLAAALAALAGAEGVDLAGLILLSPWLDLTVSARSYDTNGGSDPLFSRESAKLAAQLYLQEGVEPDHPIASPIFGPITSFPSVLLNVGAGEVLFDDAYSLAARLRDADIEVELLAVAGMDHIAVVHGLTLPGAAETFDRVTAFIERLLT